MAPVQLNSCSGVQVVSTHGQTAKDDIRVIPLFLMALTIFIPADVGRCGVLREKRLTLVDAFPTRL